MAVGVGTARKGMRSAVLEGVAQLRDGIAAEIMVQGVLTGANLGAAPVEQRRELFELLAQIAFEAAETFIDVRAQRQQQQEEAVK